MRCTCPRRCPSPYSSLTSRSAYPRSFSLSEFCHIFGLCYSCFCHPSEVELINYDIILLEPFPILNMAPNPRYVGHLFARIKMDRKWRSSKVLEPSPRFEDLRPCLYLSLMSYVYVIKLLPALDMTTGPWFSPTAPFPPSLGTGGLKTSQPSARSGSGELFHVATCHQKKQTRQEMCCADELPGTLTQTPEQTGRGLASYQFNMFRQFACFISAPPLPVIRQVPELNLTFTSVDREGRGSRMHMATLAVITRTTNNSCPLRYDAIYMGSVCFLSISPLRFSRRRRSHNGSTF